MRFNDPLNLMCNLNKSFEPLQNNVKPMIQKEDMIKLQEYKINETTQEGSGFLDVLKNTFKTTKRIGTNIGSKLNNFNNSETGTLAKNIIASLLSKSKYQRPGYPGEKHTILTDWDGNRAIANYAGPFTHFKERQRRGDKPVSFIDKVAEKHDSVYDVSRGNTQAIRKADNEMIKALSSPNLQHPREAMLARNAILGKKLLENVGIRPLPNFSGRGLYLQSYSRSNHPFGGYKKQKKEKAPPKNDVAKEFRKKLLKKYGL